MSHKPKKQSTGSFNKNKDRHQTSKPHGPGVKPGPTKTSYVGFKFQPGTKPKR